MPATAVTELGAAGGRGLVIDHLINIDGSFTSNGAPRLRYFEAEPGGRGDVRIGRRGPGNVADERLLQGHEDRARRSRPGHRGAAGDAEHALAVSSAGLRTTATTTTWAGTGSPAATPTVNATTFIQQLAGLGYYVTLNKVV